MMTRAFCLILLLAVGCSQKAVQPAELTDPAELNDPAKRILEMLDSANEWTDSSFILQGIEHKKTGINLRFLGDKVAVQINGHNCDHKFTSDELKAIYVKASVVHKEPARRAREAERAEADAAFKKVFGK